MYDLTARFLAFSFKRKNVLNYIFLYTDHVTIFTDLPLISIKYFYIQKVQRTMYNIMGHNR